MKRELTRQKKESMITKDDKIEGVVSITKETGKIIVKCPRCGEEYSSTYCRCPFCEEEDRPRKVKKKKRSGRHTAGKKKTYSGRNALIIILLLVLALLTWVLFGEKLIVRFSKPDEPEPPVEEVTPPPAQANDDPFYDPSVGDGVVDTTDVPVPNTEEPPADTNISTSNAALNKTDFTANVGESVKLKVTGTEAAVTWSVDDSSIASVSADGVVMGIQSGKTNVYAKAGDRTLTCVVRIR